MAKHTRILQSIQSGDISAALAAKISAFESAKSRLDQLAREIADLLGLPPQQVSNTAITVAAPHTFMAPAERVKSAQRRARTTAAVIAPKRAGYRRKRRTKITDAVRGQIFAALSGDNQLSSPKIAEQFGIAQSTAHRLKTKWVEMQSDAVHTSGHHVGHPAVD